MSQKQANEDMLKLYSQVIAIGVLILFLAILGARHFNTMQSIVGSNIEVERDRFENVLALIRSQWLTNGRPKQLPLSWLNSLENNSEQQSSLSHKKIKSDGLIRLSSKGWPLLNSNDEFGCTTLWQQLLGNTLVQYSIAVSYEPEIDMCWYKSENESRVSYQPSTGKVTYLEHKQ